MNTKHHYFYRNVGAARKIRAGFEAALDSETIRVEAIRSDIVRIKISRGGVFDEKPSEAVLPSRKQRAVKTKLSDRNGRIRLSLPALDVEIVKDGFHLSVSRPDGSAIFRSASDENGQSLAYCELNDHFAGFYQYTGSDAIFGLGEKSGAFNRRSRSFELWNTDVLNPNAKGAVDLKKAEKDSADDQRGTGFDPFYISIPFFYHADAATGKIGGVFIDNPARASFEFPDEKWYSFRFHGGQYTVYIFAGPTMKEILDGYTELTGRMERPPLWTLGHHQCRWFPYKEKDFRKLAETYRKKGIPCDSLWFDINHMSDYRVFTWDKKLYPNPPKLLRDLKKQGFRTITSVDPGLCAQRGYAVYEEGLKKNVYCRTESGSIYVGQVWPGRTVFPDFFRQDVRKWWAQKIATHVSMGLTGVWVDMNEPATGEIDCHSMRFDGGRKSHLMGHNEYGILMCEATRDGQLLHNPNQRTFVLSRAGSAGIQRCAANWTGDLCSSWGHLWMSITMCTGLGVSGQPFIGSDIPGFFEHATPELMMRWYQFAVFTPFFRNHSCFWTADQYPWSHGKTVESICRDAIALRYRLLPYLYTAFVSASETGFPVMKPMAFEYPEDLLTWQLDDQFLCGDHLLVAPVYQSGATHRQVYLPEGGWYGWGDGEFHRGGRYVSAPTPMEAIPVYIREGGIIPTYANTPQTTLGRRPDEIEWLVATPRTDGKTVKSLLVEDDGETFRYKSGEEVRTTFETVRHGNKVTLKARTKGSMRNGKAHGKFSTTIRLAGAALLSAKVNGNPVALKGASITIPGRPENLTAEFIVG